MCIDVMVAPSTTTAARLWNRGKTRRSCDDATPPRWWRRKWRLFAAEFPDGDAKPLRFVGEVVLDSRARKMHDADWQHFEHGVVALEGCCLGMPGPVRLERDLWHLAGGRPFGSDQLCALWRAAVDQHHVGMLGVNLVEAIPDQTVVVEVEAAGKCDFWPCWQHDLCLNAALGSDEIAGVDHCCGERAVVDE